MTDVITLADKFKLFDEVWSPRLIGELNGQYVKLAKCKGQFVWHSHSAEDEFFQVIHGQLLIHFRDKTVTLNAGDCLIVPRGVEHNPEAPDAAHILLFEPKATAHTGDTDSELTIDVDNQATI